MQNYANYTKKDLIVMKLLHYFITEQGYSPIILRGAKDEIWLENQEKSYKIIRIVSNYIHNNAQYEEDLFRTKSIIKSIKKKTFNIKMNTLSIFVNLGDNVNLISDDHLDCVLLEDEKDISRYSFIYDYFPNIEEKMDFSEKGVNLFVKITNDINQKNIAESKKIDDIFTPKKPILTSILMGINIVIFLISFIFNYSDQIITLLSTYGPYIRQGEYYRLLTGAFVQVDMLHLIFNMYALNVIGSQIESFYGKWKYLFVYLFSAIAGSLLSITFSNNPSIGSSGAIFGLLGAILYFGYYYRVYLGNTLKKTIVPIIILNLLLGFILSGVDNAAHIGGLLGGIISSAIVGIKYKSNKVERINGIIIGALFIMFLIYFAIIR